MFGKRKGNLYWIVILIVVIVGGLRQRSLVPVWTFDIVLLILLVLLGWSVYGPPIQ